MNILLTGASGSLGKEFVKEFQKRNFNYYTQTNSIDLGEKNILCNFNDPKNLLSIKDYIKKNNITHLINNAGIYINGELNDLTDQSVVDLININLLSPILLSKYLYEHLAETNQSGKIININSIAGKQPNYLESVYSASKHGLAGFGASLSINQKKSRIQIIDCFVGGIKSNITKNRLNYDSLMQPSTISKFIVDLLQSKEDYTVSSIDLRNNV
jgi:short-subunit dehydrogenase